jgi:DNA topoisomerase IA
MSIITVITEKNSVSIKLATAMGWSKSPFGFSGQWMGNTIHMVPARGHLLTLPAPDEIQPGLGWNNPRAMENIPRAKKLRLIKDPEDYKGRRVEQHMDNIQKALSLSDEVILATDADREGEYIGWSILEHLKWSKPVRRCWLASGEDPASMQKSMANLLPGFEKKALARAAEARAHCDHAYMYITRVFSHYGQYGLLGSHLGRGASPKERVISLGRVQSAALYMIYKREEAIRNFIQKTFFNITGDFNTSGISLNAEYTPKVTREMTETVIDGVTWEPQGNDGDNKPDKPLFTGKAQVDAFVKRLEQNASKSKVLEYSEGTSEQHPPITFDLVAAKSALIKATKITGDVAQVVIEDLSSQGYLSYPRTAHGELPAALYAAGERNPLIQSVMNIPGLTSAAQQAMAIHDGKDPKYKAFKPKCFTTKKLEHHGLIPTLRAVNAQVLANMSPQKKTGNSIAHTAEHMRVAYKLVAEQFIQALLPPVKLATQKITFSVPVVDMLGSDQSLFVAKAARTVDFGWRGIMNVGSEKNAELPKLRNGDPALLEQVILKEGKTKAPVRYTEQNFEEALKNAAREVDDPQLRKYVASGEDKPMGIGTPATRDTIIPILKSRAYITVEKGALFLASKGKELIDYQRNSGHDWMHRIETTAQWEGKLGELALLEDDKQAMALRNQFIEDNLLGLEEYITWMNDKYANAEKKQLERAPSAVSDKMKVAIKSIAERKGIKPPSGTLSDPAKAKAFLDEHMPKREPGAAGATGAYPPSEAQMSLITKIEAACGVAVTDEIRASSKLASEYIEKYKPVLDKQYKSSPPSEKMIKYAQNLAAKLPADKKPGNEVFERMDACKKFIDEQTKGSSGSSGSGAKSSGKPAAKGKTGGGSRR